MREFIRPAAIACALVLLATVSAPQAQQQTAPSQAAQPTLKQMALSEKQIEGVLAAQKEMDAVTEKLPDNAKPDAKVLAQLDGIASKNGLAGSDEYYAVVDNITLVLGGIDPATRKYVGSEAVIKTQIAEVEADKKMSANDKKQALDELNAALKTPEPAIENKGNIDLVIKYYDRLSAVLGEDQN